LQDVANVVGQGFDTADVIDEQCSCPLRVGYEFELGPEMQAIQELRICGKLLDHLGEAAILDVAPREISIVAVHAASCEVPVGGNQSGKRVPDKREFKII